jgi:hypothetical protein
MMGTEMVLELVVISKEITQLMVEKGPLKCEQQYYI